MDKINVGDRVKDDFLGEGEVVKIIKNDYGDDGAYMILFDKTPPVRYNMGENPALMFDTEKIVAKEANDG